MAAERFSPEGHHVREVTGSEGLETTLLKAVKALASHGIPHWVGGGFAVQERGYPRYTLDLDIIVPDVAVAVARLAGNGFGMVAPDRVVDYNTEIHVRSNVDQPVEVHLLPGGANVGRGPLPLPMPTQVSDEPQVLSLESILSGKLSAGMMRDLADAIELIKRKALPREFPVRAEVRATYERLWNIARAEMEQAEMIRESQDGTPSGSRMRDFADLVELIKCNALPRTFQVRGEVQPSFEEAWGIARAEMEKAEGIRKSLLLRYERRQAAAQPGEDQEANGLPENGP